MKPEEETEEEEETKLDVCSAQDIFFDFKPPVPVPVAVGEQVAVGEPTTAPWCVGPTPLQREQIRFIADIIKGLYCLKETNSR